VQEKATAFLEKWPRFYRWFKHTPKVEDGIKSYAGTQEENEKFRVSVCGA